MGNFKERAIYFLKQAFKYRVLVILLVLTAAFLGVGGMQYLFSEEQNIPVSFVEARNRSVALTSEIVSIIGTSAAELELMAKDDEAKNLDKALERVRKSLDLNEEARSKATLLAKELEIMAQALPVISPSYIQKVATSAITAEVSLISHFITYNDNYNRLLEILRAHFLGEDSGSDALTGLAKNVGQEIGAINQLNEQFYQLINQLDGYLR